MTPIPPAPEPGTTPDPERRLAGTGAIVTGAGRGIGQAIAGALAHDGAHVVLAGRTRSTLEETAALIAADGGVAHVVPADVTDAADVAALMAAGTRLVGDIDLLVNNAGGSRSVGPLFSMEADEWWADVELNFKTSVLCSRAVLPAFIERRSGRIVNIGSRAGVRPNAGISAYSCAKAALTVFGETLAESVADLGIGVFTLSPGTVHTPIVDELVATPRAKRWLPYLSPTSSRTAYISPDRAAGHVVRIARGDADALSGRFLHAEDDLDDLVERAGDVARNGELVLRLT
jgi:NAD(P)-dependent dehydrogenase (short-subunit alcohol dehydrogenase family)